MRGLLTLWVFSFMLFAAGEESSTEDETTEHVIELGEDNFDAAIETHPLIMVEFYAPWCGHCKNLAPQYERAAEVLSAINIPLAKVDATAHSDLANKYGISGYPTLKVFHDGVSYDYEGPRTAVDIINYMQEENKPDWAPPPDYVMVLTNDNFTQTVQNSPLMLVEFYAPWCGHCKRLEPEYKKAAADLHEKGIPLAKVDATADDKLANRFGVNGYPTLFIFRNGVKFTYNGPRERYGIVDYMVEQSKPPAGEVTTMKELNRILKSDKPPMVLLCSEEMLDSFYELANAGRETFLMFKHSPSPSLCAEVGLEMGTAGILMPYFYRSDDESWLIPIDLEEAELKSVVKAARPLVAIRTKDTKDAWYTNYPMLVAYTDTDTSNDGAEDFQFWRKRLLKVARKYPELTVAMSSEVEYQNELTELGISDRGDDVAMVIWETATKRFVMKEDDEYTEFVEAYIAGELKPHVRSQPKPKKDKGPVKTVVGSTFKDIVLDRSKHVFIEFYAPWCGHCKKLEPIYKDLGKKFKKNNDVVIAKFDATANDAPPEFEFKGFPTLFFIKAGSNEVILYEGDRDVKAMAGFIKKQIKMKDEL